jgi:hypothetical protein
MAAFTADSEDGGAVGGGAGGGGAGACGCGVAREDVAAVGQPSPEQKAATAFARAVVASPCKTSHRWASRFGGGVE